MEFFFRGRGEVGNHGYPPPPGKEKKGDVKDTHANRTNGGAPPRQYPDLTLRGGRGARGGAPLTLSSEQEIRKKTSDTGGYTVSKTL